MIDAVRFVDPAYELIHVTPHPHMAVSVCTALLWQLKFIRNPLAIDIIHSIGCVLFRPSTPLHPPPHLCLACFHVVPTHSSPSRHSVCQPEGPLSRSPFKTTAQSPPPCARNTQHATRNPQHTTHNTQSQHKHTTPATRTTHTTRSQHARHAQHAHNTRTIRTPEQAPAPSRLQSPVPHRVPHGTGPAGAHAAI